MVIVAVVATVFTAGVATPGILAGGGASLGAIFGAGVATLGGAAGLGVSIGAAALGSFVGSVASQLVGKALGVVDHFSLRQAVGAGISGGIGGAITFGLGNSFQALLRGSQWARAAASAALNTVGSYAGNSIAGVKGTSFSWKAIAANTVAAGLTSGVSSRIGLTTDNFAQNFTRGMIGGVVSLHTRRAFGFDDQVNYGNIAADAFGNAVGNALVEKGLGGSFFGPKAGEQSKRENVVGEARKQYIQTQVDKLTDSQKASYNFIKATDIDADPAAILKTVKSQRELSADEIQQLKGASEMINRWDINPVFDKSNPNQYLVFISHDGTDNNYDDMMSDTGFATNPGILANELVVEGPNVRRFYIPGIGTEDGEGKLNSATGLGGQERVRDTYDRVSKYMSDILLNVNKNAEFVMVYTGFSRGAATISEFSNYFAENVSSNINYRNGGMLLFDRVYSMGVGGNDIDMGYHKRLPSDMGYALHITANDESRRFFPLASIAPNSIGMLNGNWREIGIPGAHSDIGGNYVNPYSHIALEMGYTFLEKLGVPLAPIGDFAPTWNDTSLWRTHDSRWINDKLLPANRSIYYYPNVERH